MQRVRISNFHYAIALPYRVLAGLEFVDYEAHPPRENARLLDEGQVDVALIASSDYARHGGYIGLDFGMVGLKESDGVVLFANCPIEQLQTIYLDQWSSSGVALLRLLLAEYWRLAPRLVRLNAPADVASMGPNEALLVIGDFGLDRRKSAPFFYDLTTEWFRMTGLPFVYSVWACRPGVLSREQSQQINDVFHKSVKVRNALADDLQGDRGAIVAAEPHRVVNTLSYHFDVRSVEGIDQFFERSARLGLLPSAHYRPSTYNIMSQSTVRRRRERPLEELLRDVIDGGRLNIRDGTRLAEEASLSDLGMAAELRRSRLFPVRSIATVLTGDDYDLEHPQQFVAAVSRLPPHSLREVSFILRQPGMASLRVYEDALRELKRQLNCHIEAFTVAQLRALARLNELELSAVIERLLQAGLDSISASGGGMLLSKVQTKPSWQQPVALEWLETVTILHRLGGKSSCMLRISAEDSWEERLVHLSKLRALQDEAPGFRYFYTELAADTQRTLHSEMKLRTSLVARLFLDNVPSVHEPHLLSSPLLAFLSLGCGANEVRLEADPSSAMQGRAPEGLRALQGLWRMGFDLNERQLLACAPTC